MSLQESHSDRAATPAFDHDTETAINRGLMFVEKHANEDFVMRQRPNGIEGDNIPGFHLLGILRRGRADRDISAAIQEVVRRVESSPTKYRRAVVRENMKLVLQRYGSAQIEPR